MADKGQGYRSYDAPRMNGLHHLPPDRTAAQPPQPQRPTAPPSPSRPHYEAAPGRHPMFPSYTDLNGTFHPQPNLFSPPDTLTGTQSRSASLPGGVASGASSSSGGGRAAERVGVTFAVEDVVGGPSSGKRARSDEGGSGYGSGPSPAGAPRGLTDKACKTCRVRKVKCDRRWPRCQRCKDRGEECDFGSMVPVDVVADLPSMSGDPRIAELEGQVVTLQMQLSEAYRAGQTDSPLKPEPILADAIRSSFFSGTRDAHLSTDHFLMQNLRSPFVWGGNMANMISLGESSLDWQLARPHLAKALSLHLVHSFFSSCCSFLPIFDPWHTRLGEICEHIDHLDPANRVAVTAFCAMGARASPHSALIGIHDVGPANPETQVASHAVKAAGVRREQACRSLHSRTYDFCNELDIMHEVTPVNFEALMVEVQMLMFNELVPKKSRTLIRLAFGQFQDLQNSTLPDKIKGELSRAYSLPLFTCDAITSAYARKVPIITVADCRQYLPDLHIPDFGVDLLERNLHKHLPPGLPGGTLTHDVLVHVTHEVHAWLGKAQRTFAEMAVHRSEPAVLSTEIYALWQALDQIHQASQNLQTTLINLDYPPIACGADGCNDLHLRFITRLDRDTMDVTLLTHSLIKERQVEGALGAALFLESEKRVRNALKLVSFYSELYITSRDPHMTYHLFWQLELLPDWTELVMQRFGEPGGPATEALEVSEVELDWFVKGLSCAAYYHPVATGRLLQMERNRRPDRATAPSAFPIASGVPIPNGGPAPPVQPFVTTATPHHFSHAPNSLHPIPNSMPHHILPHPPHTQVHPAPRPSPTLAARIPAATSGLVGAAWASGTTLVAPVNAAMSGTVEQLGGEVRLGPTRPEARKDWGDWSGEVGMDWEGTGL